MFQHIFQKKKKKKKNLLNHLAELWSVFYQQSEHGLHCIAVKYWLCLCPFAFQEEISITQVTIQRANVYIFLKTVSCLPT